MSQAEAPPLDPATRLSAVIAYYRDAPAVPVMHERLTSVSINGPLVGAIRAAMPDVIRGHARILTCAEGRSY